MVFLTLLSIALIYVDHHYTYLNKVRYYLGTVTYSIYYLTNAPIRAWEWAYYQLGEQSSLKEKNAELKQKNMILNAEIQKFSTLRAENRRLKSLFKATQQQKNKKSMIANLIATNYTPFRQHIILDKGKNDNVYIGQPILDSKGVMGQIISITPFSSIGMLISDPSHSMLVQVGDLGVRSLLVGTGNPNQLKLEYLPPDVSIAVGDTAITSGLDRRYPPDYPIGYVSQVIRTKNDTFANILIKPYANLNYGREVLLIWESALADKVMKREQK